MPKISPLYLALSAALAVVLGIPFALRAGSPGAANRDADLRLIVVTPHVQQICAEFGTAFSSWHEREHGEPVFVDFRTPGGTSEIIAQLQAQYSAAVASGRYELVDGRVVFEQGSVGFDLMFGGGTYDHGRLVRNGPRLEIDGESVAIPMSEPAGFDQQTLDAWYGENVIGASTLYHPEQYWLGTAMSTFGIVYNKQLVDELGVGVPTGFGDLTDPRYASWIALADPRQSGSITTTFDSILANFGWDEGWSILRGMTANSRYFTNSSTKPPIDISQGDAAAGLAIDFYGRGQAQSIVKPGEDPSTSRIGYVDPAGSVYIDPDPVSVLAGCEHPELARRFIRFVLTEEGQALWQFRASDASNPAGPNGEPMGPEQYELRRLPVRRVMYEKYESSMVDRGIDPWALASDVSTRGWRSSIGVMMGAFAIETADEQRAAWRAIHAAEQRGADAQTLAEMRRLFYAFPEHEMPDGTVLQFNEENYRAIRNSWRDPEFPDWAKLSEIRYTSFFRENYLRVIELARGDA